MTLTGLLTVLAVAHPDAAEISVDNSLSGEAAGGPVALHHITVTIYKSRTVPFEKPFTKAIVGSNEIVDVLPISDRTLYLQGKKLCTTNVSVFDSEGRLVSILDVEVAIDIGEIQQKIQRSIGLDVVRVSATGSQVTLTGMVPDTVVADRAISVAKGLAGDAVVNAMQIAPSQQVMLEVRFLEVARSAGRDLGVNLFLANSSGTRGFNTGAPGVTPPITSAGQGPGNVPIFTTFNTFVNTTTGPFATILANIISNGHGSLDALVTALEQKGPDPPARRAEPDRALRRHRPLPGRRRVSRSSTEYDIQRRADGYDRLQEIRRRIGFHSDSLKPPHHQPADRAVGQRTRFHQYGGHTKHGGSYLHGAQYPYDG